LKVVFAKADADKMNIAIPKNIKELKQHLKDPLYKNSFFIILTSVTSAEFGFVFWLLAAKLYQPEDVGIATALISSMALLVLLTRFGLDFSIIRFFPENHKSKVFSTSVIITSFFAILFGMIFIIGIDVFSPELQLLKLPENALLFILFLATSSVASIINISFVAIRKAKFYFFQSVIAGSRVILIIPLVFLGAIGIFGAFGITLIFAILVSLFFLIKAGIRPRFEVDKSFLNEAFHFYAGNYLASLFIMAPNSILPIMVLNIIGAQQTAYYYIAFAIASLLFMIPNAVTMSLFVEGSYGEALKKTTIKALLAIFSLLIPAVIFLFFAGGWVLRLIGTDYSAHGLELLRIMVLASIFLAVNFIYYSIKRIQKDVKGLVLLSGLIFTLLVGLSYPFMLHFGIVGAGYAWVVSHTIGAVIVGVMVKREGWI
jgi:O-antigen/teichoic acid export membrane protein